MKALPLISLFKKYIRNNFYYFAPIALRGPFLVRALVLVL